MGDFGSAEEIGYNEDLITEILLNLPAKSLVRFKVVSKQWMSIISGTNFCLAHTRCLHAKGSVKPSALFIVRRYGQLSGMLLPLTRDCIRLPCFDFVDAPNVNILQSCNGLLLCASKTGYQPAWTNARYFICNPTTRKFKMLSIPRRLLQEFIFLSINLAFDPLKSPHHKIIYLRRKREGLLPWEFVGFIDIYSSETNSWSLSICKFSFGHGVEFSKGVFFNGAIYWFCETHRSSYFDIENECMKSIPMPRFETFRHWYFGESGGYLNFTIAYSSSYAFQVFEMAADRSSWYLKYRLNLTDLTFYKSVLSHSFGSIKYFCGIQSGEEGDSIVLVFEDGSTLSCNLKDRTIKKGLHCAALIPDGHYFHLQLWGSQYFETLACIL
ncbi:hypothetical protein like AT5G07610 [Hibiscus trionum]|uniref:F-box domain-containing protein n=1 Tax=Hibiscus trionum TaxID=183268 RepID=A0A9W7JAA0_HIBTR|nr:hypothetical protein like AT5G07610 [Hibiscus trionum]